MYEFRDVTEVSEGTILPSEALKINGEYIENLIVGYRTLSVSGREALSPDVMSEEVGASDGSRLKRKRYPERTIVIKYQLITKTPEDFRAAYNRLAYILDVENAELIFNDEPDKFFRGTPCVIGNVDAGKNSVIGEFEILCTDPFKYSVIEYEATADLDNSSILIDYNGTYKAYPVLQAEFYKEADTEESSVTGAGDCGYVAFYTEDEKIVQLGSPNEIDSETVKGESETLHCEFFTTSSAWITSKNMWKLNDGTTTEGASSQTGDVAIGVESYAQVASSETALGTLLTVASDIEAPTVNYKISAKMTERKADEVKINISFTASLGRDSSYFGHGFGLKGSIYLGKNWYDITLKKTTDYWRGRTGHTVSFKFTVTGMPENAVSLKGIKFKVVRTDSVGGKTGILGETACENIEVPAYIAPTPERYYLCTSNYGTGNKWHGPSITKTIRKDSAGDVGAKNFKLSFSHKLSIGSGSSAINQMGGFEVSLVTANDDFVVRARILKNKSGKKARVKLAVNNEWKIDDEVDVSYGNKNFDPEKAVVISKIDDLVTFDIANKKYYIGDPEISEMAVREVTFHFQRYANYPVLEHNGLRWVKFIKDIMVEKNLPNKFSANDILQADCSNGEITLNGVSSPELGALGNDWEDFCLTTGLNQIGFSFSDWVLPEYAPLIKVKYREVFL